MVEQIYGTLQHLQSLEIGEPKKNWWVWAKVMLILLRIRELDIQFENLSGNILQILKQENAGLRSDNNDLIEKVIIVLMQNKFLSS